MKVTPAKVGLILVFLFLGQGIAPGQSLESYWIAPQPDAAWTTADQKVDAFVADQRGPQSARHLARVFRKFHHSFLKKYQAYADFPSLFSSGTYDCLTATTLLNHVLVKLGYETVVIETTYHIFITVRLADGEVLLETTDRIGGFIMDDQLVADRTSRYRDDKSFAIGNETGYRYHASVFRTVKAADLVGLLLYNQAVKAYNSQQWISSARYLEASFAEYPSDRCYELAAILLRTVHEHAEIAPEARRSLLEHLAPVIVRRSATVAVN